MFGLNLSLPIRSHAATADLADSLVQKKRDALNVRTIRQQVRLSVLNAVSSVNASKEALKLALSAKEYAQKYLDAENQKYQLGAEPMQFVLQAQTQLSQAESAVVQNQVGLRRNLVNLLTQTGRLLDEPKSWCSRAPKPALRTMEQIHTCGCQRRKETLQLGGTLRQFGVVVLQLPLRENGDRPGTPDPLGRTSRITSTAKRVRATRSPP